MKRIRLSEILASDANVKLNVGELMMLIAITSSFEERVKKIPLVDLSKKERERLIDEIIELSRISEKLVSAIAESVPDCFIDFLVNKYKNGSSTEENGSIQKKGGAVILPFIRT